MVVKPQSKIYEFYQENLSEFNPALKLLDGGIIETTLKNNKTGWPKLKQLCGSDKELMIAVLGFVLILQLISKKIGDLKKMDEKRKTRDQNIRRDTIRYMENMVNKGCEHIRKVRGLDPSLDPNELKKRMKKWVHWKMHLYHRNLVQWDDAIDWACLVDPSIDQDELRKNLWEKYKILKMVIMRWMIL